MQTRHNTASIDNHTQSMIKHTFYPQELCTKVPHSLPYWTRPPKTQHMGHESLVLETPHCSQPRDTWSHPTKSDHGRIGPAPLTNQNRLSTTHRRNIPSAQLPALTAFIAGSLYSLLNSPLLPGYCSAGGWVGAHQSNQPIVLDSLWSHLW